MMSNTFDPGDIKAPGAECLAVRDNTGKPHIQMRQTWFRSIDPKGNTIPIVYGNLNQYTTLKDPTCNTPNGTSGYMQLIDFDLSDSDPTKHVSTVGYATFVTDTKAVKTDGAVMAHIVAPGWKDVATYNGTSMDFSLPADQMSPSDKYPPGLPPPMPQPWAFEPTKAKRLTKNFDAKADRLTLLKMFDTTDPASIARPENGGFTGVFFFDDKTGISHGFSPLSWLLIYDPLELNKTTPTSFIIVPIREAETQAQFNDPTKPNCVGRLRADGMGGSCVPSSDPTKPPWLGWPGVNDKEGEGSASVHGYFLITELEQIFSSVLQSTLCVSYPTAAQSAIDGWSTSSDKRCRASTNPKHWNPSDPTNGLPPGDWCAETSDKPTASCHDAYRSDSFHAFQGFPIKLDANNVPVVAAPL
jgi:hypothetical protein